MANDVFANGREISCKAGSGKSIAAFPDVCMTPPENPATPPGTPVPYPNTGMASDTSSGSKNVKISDKEVMLKNKSFFKKGQGNEAGCAAKKGVVTSTNHPPGAPSGSKAYFNAWSMDVKIERKNAVRHFDITTHNHASQPGNTPPWPFIDSMAIDGEGNTDDPCAEEKEAEQEACEGVDDPCGDPPCQDARKCQLVPYGGSGSPNCCDGVTGHHMIEDHWVQGASGFGTKGQGSSGRNAAPTVCVDGTRYTDDHGHFHMIQGLIEESYMEGGVNQDVPWTYGEGKFAAVTAHQATFGDRCSKECLEAQLDSYYEAGDDVPMNQPHTQPLAKTDKGDDRWLRQEAEAHLEGLLPRGTTPPPASSMADALKAAGYVS